NTKTYGAHAGSGGPGVRPVHRFPPGVRGEQAMQKRRVAVTGLGLISPCGTGVEKSWEALVNGRSGVGPITLFDASRLDSRIAGEVKDFEPEDYIERREV